MKSRVVLPLPLPRRKLAQLDQVAGDISRDDCAVPARYAKRPLLLAFELHHKFVVLCKVRLRRRRLQARERGVNAQPAPELRAVPSRSF